MTLTPTNYIDQSCQVDFAALPGALKKGHDLALSAFKDGQMAYKGNDTVKAVMDHYLKELNAVLSKKPSKKPSKPKSKKSATLKPIIGKVPKISEEVSFVRRFLWLDGKIRERKSLETLLFALQKAMVERRIRKNSPYATEIMAIQTDLINLLAEMGDSVEIAIDPKRREEYQKIVKSQTVRQSVRLLKRFIPLQGKTGIDQKVERLHKQVVALTESSDFNKQNPYHPYVMQMLDELNYYLEDMDDDDPEMGINPQYLGKLPEIMTSQQLLSLDFETIGLQGKWRELIGDPSVGFSMMVFGQPKSGKSTLMLEFAQYLAEHHGKTLYVAIEEGFGYTLKDKIERLGATSENLSFAAEMPQSLEGLDFVFIDSISRGGLEIEDLIQLQEKYPRVGFIYIFHTTKDGRFRGGNHYAHEVDVIVEVSSEEISASGRFASNNQIAHAKY